MDRFGGEVVSCQVSGGSTARGAARRARRSSSFFSRVSIARVSSARAFFSRSSFSRSCFSRAYFSGSMAWVCFWGVVVVCSGVRVGEAVGQSETQAADPTAAAAAAVAPRGEIFDCWPQIWLGRLPGDPADLDLPPEGDTSGPTGRLVAGRPVIRLGNVIRPQVEVFHPPGGAVGRGAAVICPGGGYHILAYDLEGTEVAAWLNSLGMTAVVLKYRVPARAGEERWRAAVIDAQRAMSWTRQQAAEWGVDPQKVGILGFSAGGHAAALVSSGLERQYEELDGVDQVSCRPDFSLLIYPGYLVEGGELSPQLRESSQFPPTFLVHTHDDPVTPLSSLTFAAHLHKLAVPVELHLYQAGGHGYGLRATDMPVTGWPRAAAEWLKGLSKAAGSP